MEDWTRLARIQRNRSRPERVRGVGSLARQVLDRLVEVDPGPLDQAADALAGLVDEEFRRHCRVARIGGGVLVVHVDQQDLVYPTRLKWVYALLKEWPRACRAWPVRRIRFEFGREGRTIRLPDNAS